jgi:hypothetical protein
MLGGSPKDAPRSIALDGCVKGRRRFNREGTHLNFDHRDDVNCTASQVNMAMKGGLLTRNLVGEGRRG